MNPSVPEFGPAPQMSALYKQFVRHLIDIHKVTMSDGEESDEAEELRLKMDALWPRLDEDQRGSLRGLSSDLNWLLYGMPVRAKRDTDSSEQSFMLAYAAAARAWHAVLHHTRLLSVHFTDRQQSTMAMLRGQAWEGLNEPELAQMFFEHAVKLHPKLQVAGALALRNLSRWSLFAAEQRSVQILGRPDNHTPAEVIEACRIVLVASLQGSRAGGLDDWLLVLTVLSGVEARLPGTHFENSKAVEAELNSLRAHCYRKLGRVDKALQSYTAALDLVPDARNVLVSRGTLLYDSDPKRALVDLRQAVALGAPSIIAHFLVARNAFVAGEFVECLLLLRRALDLNGSSAIQAVVVELSAMCLVELKQNPAAIRQQFSRAIELDPANHQIRENLSSFENLVAAGDAVKPVWQVPTDQVVKVYEGTDAFLQQMLNVPSLAA